LLEQLQRPALGRHIAEQHAQHGAAGIQRRHGFPPTGAVAGEVFFAEEIEDDRQIAAALAVVVNQQNLGFTPHLVRF